MSARPLEQADRLGVRRLQSSVAMDRRSSRDVAVRFVVVLAAVFLVLGGFMVAPTAGEILFAADANVPPAVRAFAWRAIETGCDFQRHEREQRSFWAHAARVRSLDGVVFYSIRILSDVPWKKTEPPALLEIDLADDGGRLRLTGLTSSFIRCRP
jgi:hypothetical protein